MITRMEGRFNYRLRVNRQQACALQQVFDSTRFVWNHTLGRWSDLWRHEGERLDSGAADKELTDLRSRFDWLAAQPSVPQQQVIRDLYKAIGAFLDNTNPAGRPRFKKKGSHSSARWTRNGFGLAADRLSVATSGGRIALRVVWSRPLPSEPTSVTVYRDAAGRWWASFVVRTEADDVGVTGQSTGLDVGLTTFATTEFPDADVPNPRFARHAAKALARSQRNVARKQKGSRNRTRPGWPTNVGTGSTNRLERWPDDSTGSVSKTCGSPTWSATGTSPGPSPTPDGDSSSTSWPGRPAKPGMKRSD